MRNTMNRWKVTKQQIGYTNQSLIDSQSSTNKSRPNKHNKHKNRHKYAKKWTCSMVQNLVACISNSFVKWKLCWLQSKTICMCWWLPVVFKSKFLKTFLCQTILVINLLSRCLLPGIYYTYRTAINRHVQKATSFTGQLRHNNRLK